MSATLSKGDKVKVHYTDAQGSRLMWDGVLKEPVIAGAWWVQVGGVAMLFKADDIEVRDEKTKTDEGPSSRPE